MTDDADTPHRPQDMLVDQLFKLSVSQTEAIMRLSHALRTDPNVSEQTRIASEQAWSDVEAMLNILNSISETHRQTAPKEGADE